MKSFLVVLALVAVAFTVVAVWQILSPPYLDAQIAASLVDTWQPHALATCVTLLLLFIFACTTLAIYIFAGKQFRFASCIALFAIFVAGGAQLAAHIALTHQVARVTGQPFGPLYGLL